MRIVSPVSVCETTRSRPGADWPIVRNRRSPTKCRRDVAPQLKRHSRPATIGVPKLSVGTSLPDFCKPQFPKQRHDLAWLENRWLCHELRHFHRLRPDELALEPEIAVIKEHLDNFLKTYPEFVQRLTLAMRARKSRHPPERTTRCPSPAR